MTILPDADLSTRLLSSNATADDVGEYLQLQGEALYLAGVPCPPIVDFFKRSDIEGYKKARDWWPTQEAHPELPTSLLCPPLMSLCWSYHESPSFNERLLKAGDRVMAWLHANKVDTTDPNRTTALTGTERNQRARARAAKPADAVAEAHKVWIARCTERKAALEHWAAYCKEAEDAWKALKNPPVTYEGLPPLPPT